MPQPGSLPTHRLILAELDPGVGPDAEPTIYHSGICMFRARQGDSLQILKDAITEWVDQTTEGREAYEACDLFAFPDVMKFLESDTLVPFGVQALFCTLDSDPVVSYNEWLYNEDIDG